MAETEAGLFLEGGESTQAQLDHKIVCAPICTSALATFGPRGPSLTSLHQFVTTELHSGTDGPSLVNRTDCGPFLDIPKLISHWYCIANLDFQVV